MKLLVLVLAAFARDANSHKPNLVELAESLNLTSFLEIGDKCGLNRMINHEAWYTVFAPSNEAFAREKFYPGEDGLCDKIRFHVGRGLVKSSQIEDEMTMKSLLSKRSIRFNIYQNKAVTANGRKIISTDHEARNGLLHILDDVMSSVYKRAGSVISEIDECCPQHSEVVELVKLAGLYGTLDQKGPFTLLAPNNGAFAKLHPDFINHLKKNRTALVNLLSAHVIPGTLYSAGLENGATFKTLAGNKLQVSKQGDDVKFGKASVTLADVTAGNGAIHAIDQVLFPTFELTQPKKQSLNLVQLLKKKGYNSFANALKETRLDKVIDHEGHFTVFAPTDQAFNSPKAYPQDTNMHERVAYYIVRGLVKESMVKDELMVPSLLSKRRLRFNVYGAEEIKTINGQPIKFTSYEAHNGIIHEISSGIDYVPPRKGSLHEILTSLPRYSEFMRLFDRFYPGLLQYPSAFTLTLLVPTNSAIQEALTTENDQDLAQKLLLNHVLPTSWYSRGLKDNLKTLGGKSLQFSFLEDKIMVNNNVQLTLADFTAENGVFHQVDGIVH